MEGEENFYTWVDERGVVHTLKKPESKTKASNPLEVTKSLSEKETPQDSKKLDTQSTKTKPEFNSADFVSSDEIDRKIAGEVVGKLSLRYQYQILWIMTLKLTPPHLLSRFKKSLEKEKKFC